MKSLSRFVCSPIMVDISTIQLKVLKAIEYKNFLKSKETNELLSNFSIQ